MELAERGYGVGPRLPLFQGLWQRTDFLVGGRESELFSELPHHGLKNFAIAAIFALLGAGFEIAVEPQDGGIVRVLSVGRENAVQAAENSFFPVDESPVAVEGEKFESAEVEHGAGISPGPNAKALKPGSVGASSLRIASVFRVALSLSDRRRIFGRSRGLGSKKLGAVQQRASERGVVAGPGTLEVGLALELGAHGLHFGIQVVHVVQQERFGKHGQLGRAEFVLAVVADDQVLEQGLEFDGKSGTIASFACSISSSMIMWPSNWPRVV